MILYPEDWQFRPTPAKAIELIHLLQQSGVLGGPAPRTALHLPVAWRPGFRIEEQLGVRRRDGFGHIEITFGERLLLYISPDSEAACPDCGSPVDSETWGELMSALARTEEEQPYTCPCGAMTGLTRLRHDPPLGLGYVALCLVDLGYEIDTNRPLWSEMEALLGTELTFTGYKL